MPTVTKAERDRIYSELENIRSKWQYIQKFLQDEEEALAPIYVQWLAKQEQH